MNYKLLYKKISDPWEEFSVYNKILQNQLDHKLADSCSLVYFLSTNILQTKNTNSNINGFSFTSLITHLNTNKSKYSYSENILKTIEKLKLSYLKIHEN